MDKLNAMSTFVRVVETGSFSAVARETHARQSTVSKQVAALERALGAKLLSRTTRSLALTEEGARYFEQARRLVAELAEAEDALHRGEHQLVGWIRVAASVGFGRLKLMPVVRSFLAQHRGLKIDLRLSDAVTDLVEQGIDVAVRVGELRDSSLVARRIGTTQRVPLAHPDYLRSLPKGVRAPRTPQDLSGHNCLVYTGVSTGNAWRFTAGPGASEPVGTTRVVRVEGNLQTNSSEVIRAAVLGGMGIASVPTWLFDVELAAGKVQQLLPHWEAPAVPIHLLSPQGRRQSAKVSAFVDYVVKMLAPP